MTTRGRLAARLGFWNLGQHPSRAFLDGHKSVPFDWLATRGLSRRGSRLPGSNDEQRRKHQVVGGPLLVSLRITATLENKLTIIVSLPLWTFQKPLLGHS